MRRADDIDRQHAVAAVDRWDRQTDGRTSYRYIDPAIIQCELCQQQFTISQSATQRNLLHSANYDFISLYYFTEPYHIQFSDEIITAD